jgi:D-alanine-D-alanine ligase
MIIRGRRVMSHLLLCGGVSSEHEVSLASARSVYAALQPLVEQVLIVGITRKGLWLSMTPEQLQEVTSVDALAKGQLPAGLVQDQHGRCVLRNPQLQTEQLIKVVFPILHGSGGEDGEIQGLLECFSVPYIGCGVSAAAVTWNKALFKNVLRAHGIPVVPGYVYRKPIRVLAEKIGLPVFVKPAATGSSIGISCVQQESGLYSAMEDAFTYSSEVLVEQAILGGSEIECAVLDLGNGRDPLASDLAEVKVKGDDFYSYRVKYCDTEKASFTIPASLSDSLTTEIQRIAIQVFKAVGARGMLRVDFLVSAKGEIYVNEANSIPGFTSISMYPKLCQRLGFSYSALLMQLMQVAFSRQEERAKVSQLSPLNTDESILV